MKKIIALSFLFFLAGCAYAPKLAVVETAPLKQYQYPSKKFSIQFPADWKIQEISDINPLPPYGIIPSVFARHPQEALVGFEIAAANSFNLSFEKLTQDLSSRDYVEKFKEYARGETEINGIKAKWFVYFDKMDMLETKRILYYIEKDGVAYILKGSSPENIFSKSEELFKKIAATFAFL